MDSYELVMKESEASINDVYETLLSVIATIFSRTEFFANGTTFIHIGTIVFIVFDNSSFGKTLIKFSLSSNKPGKVFPTY